LVATNYLAGIGGDVTLGGNDDISRSVDSQISTTAATVSSGQAEIDAAQDQIAEDASNLPSISDGPLPIADAQRQTVDDYASGSRDTVRDPGVLSGISPELTKAESRAKAVLQGAQEGASQEVTLSDSIRNSIKPVPGFTGQLTEGLSELIQSPAGSANTETLAAGVIGRLQGAVYAQQSNIDVQEVYDNYKDLGYDTKSAVIATYGEIGGRQAGASDLFVAGVTAAATGSIAGGAVGGERPSKVPKSKLLLARAGGAAAGVALFAAGVVGRRGQDRLSAEQASIELGNDLKAEFKATNPEGYEKFAKQIDAQKNIEGVNAVLTEYYTTGEITDNQINQLENTSEETISALWAR